MPATDGMSIRPRRCSTCTRSGNEDCRLKGFASPSSATWRIAASPVPIFMRLSKLGAEVRVVGPPTMIPKGIEKLGAKVFYNLDEALRGVQVIMMLRLQLERQGTRPVPDDTGICASVWADGGSCQIGRSRRDRDASGTHQSRRGDCPGSCG